jgi:hypothetical protein
MICWQDFKIYNAIFIFCHKDTFQFVNSCLFDACFSIIQRLTNWENILTTKNKYQIINFEIPLKQTLNKKNSL